MSKPHHMKQAHLPLCRAAWPGHRGWKHGALRLAAHCAGKGCSLQAMAGRAPVHGDWAAPLLVDSALAETAHPLLRDPKIDTADLSYHWLKQDHQSQTCSLALQRAALQQYTASRWDEEREQTHTLSSLLPRVGCQRWRSGMRAQLVEAGLFPAGPVTPSVPRERDSAAGAASLRCLAGRYTTDREGCANRPPPRAALLRPRVTPKDCSAAATSGQFPRSAESRADSS